MIRLTKIFTFETAHALYGYDGPCKDIHGHSYELHVTLTSPEAGEDYIPSPGIAFDFKEIKRIVNSAIIKTLDHKLILSSAFLKNNPAFSSPENLLVWEAEPSAENMLIYIKKKLSEHLPNEVILVYLKLYETKNSYAELCLKI
ncbi:MAG: 6-carboxytetrahydropterin synthase [Bacteroidetes bacterium]|nr:6-carboxytetrahydropterin synthase [Bacteroidota bacterium]